MTFLHFFAKFQKISQTGWNLLQTPKAEENTQLTQMCNMEKPFDLVINKNESSFQGRISGVKL